MIAESTPCLIPVFSATVFWEPSDLQSLSILSAIDIYTLVAKNYIVVVVFYSTKVEFSTKVI